MTVDLTKDDISTLVDALKCMFSEQPSAVHDDEEELLARLEALLNE